MTMKIVAFDLHDASRERRDDLNDTLERMGFTRILRTVWTGDVNLSPERVRERMNLKDGDKAFVAELDENKEMSHYGLEPDAKRAGLDPLLIYRRLNNRRLLGKVGEFRSLPEWEEPR